MLSSCSVRSAWCGRSCFTVGIATIRKITRVSTLPSWDHRSKPALGLVSWQCPLGDIPSVQTGLAALHPVFLPVVRLVFLYHLASHLPAGGATRHSGNRRPSRHPASVSGGLWIIRVRNLLLGFESLDW